MKMRFAVSILAMMMLVGCQSGGDKDGVEALTSAAHSDVQASGTATEATVADAGEPATADEEVTASVSEDAATRPVTPPQSQNEAVMGGVRSIAQTYSAKGRDAALREVLACYRRVEGRSATIEQAKVCAAQDFVVSRTVTDAYKAAGATAKRDRTVIVAERVAERIGALMQLKGMNQAQFNRFGLYLHQVAMPEFRKARA